MPRNEHKKPHGCLDTIALVLASITFSLGLWAGFCAALGLIEPYTYQHPCGTDIGTDFWIECTYGEEMDLTPIIEDEAQTTEGERA